MIVTLLALAQMTAGPPAAPASTGPVTTAPRAVIASCPDKPDEDGDIIVCARVDHGDQYRLKPLTHRYDPVPGPGIGMKVGAGRANLYTTSQVSPDGKPDKRIMVTLKMPF